MAADLEFYEGFDTYGPPGFLAIDDGVSAPSSTLIGGEWTSVWAGVGASSDGLDAVVAPSLIGPGQALRLVNHYLSGQLGISRTFTGNFARCRGAGVFMAPVFYSGQRFGLVFGDAGVDQLAITVEASGQIGIRRASGSTASALVGTLLALSDESAVAGLAFDLEWDITIDNAAGAFKVWLNGAPTTLNATGQDTQNTANATFNQLRLMISKDAVDGILVVDHLYCGLYSSGGSGALTGLRPIVETQFPIADHSTDFAIGAAILGPDWVGVGGSNAPGANQLFLRKFTPDVAGTLGSVSIVPAASSLVAKFKAVAYADSADAPGALLTSGTEVIGCTADVELVSALTSAQSLAAATPIWIGFIADSSIALRLSETGIEGRKVANTYGSGAPNPAGAMTLAQPSWTIFGNVSGVTETWSVVDSNPHGGDHSFVASATPGDVDLLEFPALSSTPTTIFGLAVKVVLKRTDAGARTVDLLTESAAVTDPGSAPGQTPPTDYAVLSSYWTLDPDTGAAWNASGVNLARHGYKVAS